MKKQLFICITEYQIMIAIIKALKCDFKTDIIICNNSLEKYEKIIDKIKKYNIFNEVIFIKDCKLKSLKNISKIRMFLYYIYNYFLLLYTSKKISVDFSIYDDIYLNIDTAFLGRVLQKKKVYYNILEDGTDCFKYYSQTIKQTKTWQFLERLFYGSSFIGESKYCKNIYVNDLNGINYKYGNIVEEKKSLLFKSFSRKQKNMLLDIFNCNVKIKMDKPYIVLITQPLYLDNYLDSINHQIEIYEFIIKNYCTGKKVIIKVHPRDTANYHKYFKDCIIINDKYPIELLNFLDIKFGSAITIFSTSIRMLECFNEKIELGFKWLDNYKNDNYK